MNSDDVTVKIRPIIRKKRMSLQISAVLLSFLLNDLSHMSEFLPSMSLRGRSRLLQASSRRHLSGSRELLDVSSPPYPGAISDSTSSLSHPSVQSSAVRSASSLSNRRSPSPHERSGGGSRVPRSLPKTAVVRPQPKFHSPPRWGEPESKTPTPEDRIAQLSKKCHMKRQDADRLASLFIHMGDHVKVPSENGEDVSSALFEFDLKVKEFSFFACRGRLSARRREVRRPSR